MERYKNIGGDSGVAGYEIGEDFIKVKFLDHSIYVYTYNSTGQHNIENMKTLALRGKGLNSFINTNVRSDYSHKE